MKRKLNSKPLEQLLREQAELFGDSMVIADGEQRPLLVDLMTSSGPWICLPGGDVLLDAAQTGGLLGFNAGACFGVAQYLESWTGKSNTETGKLLKDALNDFLKRKERQESVFIAELKSPFQMARTYIQLNVVDQFETQIESLVRLNGKLMFEFQQKHASLFSMVQSHGMKSAIDCATPADATRFCEIAVEFGLWLSCDAPPRINIAINSSWTEDTLNIFWRQMGDTARDFGGQESSPRPDIPISLRDPSSYFRFHQAMSENKLAIALGRQPKNPDSASGPVLDFIRENLNELDLADCQPVVVDPENWPKYRSAVEVLQAEVYEPARQTPVIKFDRLLNSPRGIGLLVLQVEEIIAIAFAGPLSLFPGERGTTEDPWRDDPDVLYMLDVTVRKSFRGSLGRMMKQALTLQAVVSGCSAIHGRNRDKLAASMWAINLSVGSIQIQHRIDDYMDNEKYRDCIYYRCPLRWELPNKGSPEYGSVSGLAELSPESMKTSLARLANGYSALIDGKPADQPGNLVPVWHRRK